MNDDTKKKLGDEEGSEIPGDAAEELLEETDDDEEEDLPEVSTDDKWE